MQTELLKVNNFYKCIYNDLVMAKKALRTLVIAYKEIDQNESN